MAMAIFSSSALRESMPVERATLPPVMEPVMEPFGSTEADPGSVQKNFIDYYNDQSVMVSSFEKLVEEKLDAYNEDKGLNDSVYLYLMAFYSWELAMGASFTEETSWEQLRQGVVMAYEMFGGTNVEAIRNDAHNYTITYTNGDGAVMTEYFRADAQNGIQMICYKDGILSEFFEFIELGDNTYVWAIYRHLKQALPVAGIDGTLKNRMKRTPAYRRVFAKTGTLTGVTSLAGYAIAPNGHTLAFVIINQNILTPRPARTWQDKVCSALCQ